MRLRAVGGDFGPASAVLRRQLKPAILLGGATSAFADPSQGANSEGRNPEGFGEGPHCHVLITDHTPFDSTPAFPSHTAHLASGVGHVFAADPNCDGLPGS